MPDRIRVGIVGASVTPGSSGWGANAHVPALQALESDYELRAVCTAHADTAAASASAFGAELAYHRFADMIAQPDVDLVTVAVRVPTHRELVLQALEAGKPVFCEWPLGANVAEAEEMANLAAAKGVPNFVGLQARSDPALMYARELVEQGYVGEVLSAVVVNVTPAVTQRGPGRIWQGDRRNGANTLTIAGGHAIDALNFVLGEFRSVSARVATRLPVWHNTETGEDMAVDSPDWVSVSGQLESGAEVDFLVTTVPFNPSGNRLEIYGSAGTLTISAGSANRGPNRVVASQGGAPLAELETPARFVLVPPSTPEGSPRNVAQAYVRIAAALRSKAPYSPDFAHAVRRHKLLAAIERASAEGVAVAP
jgi:predicted dehydrogenase